MDLGDVETIRGGGGLAASAVDPNCSDDDTEVVARLEHLLTLRGECDESVEGTIQTLALYLEGKGILEPDEVRGILGK